MTFGEEIDGGKLKAREVGIEKYADLIDRPRPELKHARMSEAARAAQFAPFAALSGYYDLVEEAGRAKLDEAVAEEKFEVDSDAQMEFDT